MTHCTAASMFDIAPLPFASRIFRENTGVPGEMPTTDSTAGSALLLSAVMMPATCVPAGRYKTQQKVMGIRSNGWVFDAVERGDDACNVCACREVRRCGEEHMMVLVRRRRQCGSEQSRGK